MFEDIAFYFFSCVVLGFFLVSILSKNTLYALSALATAMVFLSGFYFLLDAEFLGVIQIIVYSGAVLGLYSFAMMFFDASKEYKEQLKSKFVISIICIFAFLLLFSLLISVDFINIDGTLPFKDTIYDYTKQLSFVIFSKYLLAFEFIAVLLLIALVCAVVLTSLKKEKQ